MCTSKKSDMQRNFTTLPSHCSQRGGVDRRGSHFLAGEQFLDPNDSNPSQVIATHTTMPKPQRIYWDKLSPQKMAEIPMLGRLKAHIEETTGQTFPTGPGAPFHYVDSITSEGEFWGQTQNKREGNINMDRVPCFYAIHVVNHECVSILPK